VGEVTKLIVAGSRYVEDYDLVSGYIVDRLAGCKTRIEIVSGGAQGVDSIAEQFAANHELRFKRFPARWNQHGKAAGPIRNREMAEYADALLAFPLKESESKGTRNMIAVAEELGLDVMVCELSISIVDS